LVTAGPLGDSTMTGGPLTTISFRLSKVWDDIKTMGGTGESRKKTGPGLTVEGCYNALSNKIVVLFYALKQGNYTSVVTFAILKPSRL
jgi:hypothetical protein